MSDLIELSELLQLVLEHQSPLAPIALAPRDALGFVLSSPVIARESLPRFANSAMDGFALRAMDTTTEGVDLRLVGSTMAGAAPLRLEAGEAIRIMTGAPLPTGADAVCSLEAAVAYADDTVRIPRAISPGTNVRLPGEDVAAGDLAIAHGCALGPAHLGLLAALGERSVSVYQQPVVAVLSTGDELSSDNGPLGLGKIRDANRPALLAMLQRLEVRAIDLGIASDDEEELLTRIELASASSDAVILSGGASRGDRDSLAAALRRVVGGASVHSLQIAIRPARPFVFTEIGPRKLPVLGLAGNPVAALIAFELIAKPLIRRLRGLPDMSRPLLSGAAADDFPRRRDGKLHFVRAFAQLDSEGVLQASPAAGQGAHMLASLANSNALVVLDDGDGVRKGDKVKLLLLGLDEL